MTNPYNVLVRQVSPQLFPRGTSIVIGDRLGDWILDKELGRGGMGTVYLARHHSETGVESPAQRTAVKVLALHWSTDPDSRSRFQREIDVLKKLDHPNVVTLLDHGTHHGMHYYVMEHVDGASLEMVLRQQGRLPWEQVLDVAQQVCLALKHTHDHGIIHRDLKPSNLLRGARAPGVDDDNAAVGRFGVIKLTDFGIAWVFAAPHLTKPGAIVGTAEYLSPEQAAGKQPSKKSDVYSLGAVLYALLTGRPPFEGEVVDLLHKHRYAQFDPPRKIVPAIPHDFDAIVCTMLDKEPANRPPDAGVLFRQLDTLRRKYQRRAAEATSRDLAAQDTAIEDDGAGQTGPATLMAELMRDELHRQNRGGPVRQFLNHPLVLITLFVMTLGLLVWSFWPASQETLYQKAKELMASESPNDWQSAEEDFIKPLEERFPGHPYKEEVAAWRARIDEAREVREAAREARFYSPVTETKWFYEKGERLFQQGKTKQARATWQNLVTAYQQVAKQDPWVKRAQKSLKELDDGKRAPPENDRWKTVNEVIARIHRLESENKKEQAAQLRDALLALYEDETDKVEIRRRLDAKP